MNNHKEYSCTEEYNESIKRKAMTQYNDIKTKLCFSSVVAACFGIASACLLNAFFAVNLDPAGAAGATAELTKGFTGGAGLSLGMMALFFAGMFMCNLIDTNSKIYKLGKLFFDNKLTQEQFCINQLAQKHNI